jgi:sugar transferase (PEP-CTERM/EpsH1 system associated)
MNILFIAPYVPSRIRIRPFYFIRELARRHSVQVIALGETDRKQIEGVQEIAQAATGLRVVPHSKMCGYLRSLAALPTPVPMCTAFCRSSEMSAAVAAACRNTDFDVVHIEHLRAAHFASACRGLPVVFDAVDCLTGLFRQMSETRKNPLARILMREEYLKLRRYEPAMLRRFDRVVVTSDSEREAMLSLDRELLIETLPNGVDTDHFVPRPQARLPHRVVFSGKMSYSPNAQAATWFAREVFPSLRNKWDDAEFVIVGSDPPPSVRALAGQPGVTVTGYVDDIRPFVSSASVAVVPVRTAVGIQNKALEALAAGLPVVASPLATRAFGSDMPGIVEAGSRERFVEAVAELMACPRVAEQMGREGRAAVMERFSWQSSVDRLERIYEAAITGRDR